MDLTGANWDKLVSKNLNLSSSFSSSKGMSRSFSKSFSGLTGDAYKKASGFFSSLTSNLNPLLGDVVNARPNQNILNSLARLNSLAVQNWISNYRPVIAGLFRKNINALANRGILDSSVASKTLAGISSGYLQNLANLESQLEMERIRKSLEYPSRTLGLLGRLAEIYGGLSRISRGTSSAYSSNVASSTRNSLNYSYNPAPAIGFLSSLMGI